MMNIVLLLLYCVYCESSLSESHLWDIFKEDILQQEATK